MLHLPQRIKILAICPQDIPFSFKNLSGGIFRFTRMVFLLNVTQLHCVLRNNISYFFKNTLLISFSQSSYFTLWLWLWLHTFRKLVSQASFNAKTLQWSAHLLSSSLQWLRYVVFKYNLHRTKFFVLLVTGETNENNLQVYYLKFRKLCTWRCCCCFFYLRRQGGGVK